MVIVGDVLPRQVRKPPQEAIVKGLVKAKSERGIAVVEFSLVLPLLLVFLIGTIEFGLLFYNKQVLTNATREAARAGTAHLTETQIKDIAVNYCSERLVRFSSDIAPTVTVSGAQGPFGSELTVTVVYDYTFLAPDILDFGPSLQLTTQTKMSMDRDVSLSP